MIVEDETTIRELISEELQKNGNLKRLEQPIFNDVLDDFSRGESSISLDGY